MHSIPNNAPSNVAALDEHDPDAGGACHRYGIQHDDGKVTEVQFQHGPRGDSSTSGVFDDDLLAIIQDRLESFQAGPFSCEENEEALGYVRMAREALGRRVAARIAVPA